MSQARGSTPFILAVTIKLYMEAARRPPRSEPQNNQDFRSRAITRKPLSALLWPAQSLRLVAPATRRLQPSRASWAEPELAIKILFFPVDALLRESFLWFCWDKCGGAIGPVLKAPQSFYFELGAICDIFMVNSDSIEGEIYMRPGMFFGAVLSFILFATGANAAIYQFTFVGTAYSIDGQFSTDGSNSVADITGVVKASPPGVDGGAIAPGPITGPDPYPGNISEGWNITNSFDGTDLDVLFSFGASNIGNLFTFEGQAYFSTDAPGGDLFNPGDMGTLTISAVPEIATWAMMVLGFAGVALLSLRRRLRATSFHLA